MGRFLYIDRVTTLTFVAATNSGATTAQVTLPAAAVGDWCFIAVGTAEDGGAEVVSPGGTWTQLAIEADEVGAIWAKVLEAGEPGSNVTVFNATDTDNRVIAVAFHPNVPIGSFAAVEAFNLFSQNTDPPAQTINANLASLPSIVLAQYYSSTAVSPRTATPAMTEVNGSDNRHFVKYRIQNFGDTPTSQSVDMDDEGTNNLLESGVVQFS